MAVYRQILRFNDLRATYILKLVEGATKAQLLQPFVFPISPQQMDRQYDVMNNMYHVQSSQSTGVYRIIDRYGETPPTFILRGTTGWNYHNTTGYRKSGLDSLDDLNIMLSTYSERVANARYEQKQSTVALEFYDFFLDEAWEVMPVGQINYRQSERSPLWVFFELRLAAVQNLGQPTQQETSLWNELSQPSFGLSNIPTLTPQIWAP